MYLEWRAALTSTKDKVQLTEVEQVTVCVCGAPNL